MERNRKPDQLRSLESVRRSVRRVLQRFKGDRHKTKAVIRVRGWTFTITRTIGSRRIAVHHSKDFFTNLEGRRDWEEYPSKADLKKAGINTFLHATNQLSFENFEKAEGKVFALIQTITRRSYETEVEKLLDE